MDASQIYVLIGIIALAIIAVVVFIRGKKPYRGMSRLTQVSFILIFFGIILGEGMSVGYGLMAIGGLLALLDIVRKHGRKN